MTVIYSIARTLVLLLSLFNHSSLSFTTRNVCSLHPRNLLASSRLHSETSDDDCLEVVLFGIGDLRTDDHQGLQRAMSSGGKVLPLVILDKTTLQNVPGAIPHTVTTAALITEALKDLKSCLETRNLALHVALGGESLAQTLSEIFKPLSSFSSINVHVCDLKDADNSIGYTAMSQLVDLPGINIESWSCNLRDDPWSNLERLPTTFQEYEQTFLSNDPIQPIGFTKKAVDAGLVVKDLNMIPTEREIYDIFREMLSLDDEKCEAEVNSGLFGTHWGGLEPSTVCQTKILELIESYITCGQDDQAFSKIPIPCQRNELSLEHAVMAWNMRGSTGSSEQPVAENLIAGERLTRALLAPLLLGTVSPRHIWHSLNKRSVLFKSPFQTFMESQEWHRLLAARNLMINDGGDGTLVKYWRWHGFLCRYLKSNLGSSPSTESPKEGLLLVHGFGASGSQYTKLIDELQLLSDETSIQCMAPDLIGFGQTEKPPMTYTGYAWEMQMGDFIKEKMTKVDNFVIAGNSIGGFITICTAANDYTLSPNAISGNGAPGTGKCSGAILMSPAGVVQTRDDVLAIEQQAGATGGDLQSVAQVTVNDSLPPAKPFPRFVARAFGSGLIRYLQPRIADICATLYPTNPSAVNENLVKDTILRDSLDPGAVNVMISGSKLPTPRTWNEVIDADFGSLGNEESTFPGPILMSQGVLDPLNDFKTKAANIKKLRSGVTVDELQAGHCPHDEVPEVVASSMMQWLKSTESERIALVQANLLKKQETVVTN